MNPSSLEPSLLRSAQPVASPVNLTTVVIVWRKVTSSVYNESVVSAPIAWTKVEFQWAEEYVWRINSTDLEWWSVRNPYLTQKVLENFELDINHSYFVVNHRVSFN